MQYLIFVLGNIVFAVLDIPLSKSQYKFYGSIIILFLLVLAIFFLIYQIIFQSISIVCRWINIIHLYITHGYIYYFIIPCITKVCIIIMLN